jgi:2-polyprenyl-3-methyl-5-hydroxy-6-metoxy-1,4-benzoquinol methylase
VDAHRHFTGEQEDRTASDRTYFLQTDLMQPAFRPGAFDFIYCGGVLHHTPSTKATFDLLVPALAPGGKIFVWLYHSVPGLSYALRMRTRKFVAELPGPVKHALVLVLLPQSMLRQRIRIARGRQAPKTRLNAREKLVTMLDSFTCRYRWEHTPAELGRWYQEAGFTDVQTTDVESGALAWLPHARRQRLRQRVIVKRCSPRDGVQVLRPPRPREPRDRPLKRE